MKEIILTPKQITEINIEDIDFKRNIFIGFIMNNGGRSLLLHGFNLLDSTSGLDQGWFILTKDLNLNKCPSPKHHIKKFYLKAFVFDHYKEARKWFMEQFKD